MLRTVLWLRATLNGLFAIYLLSSPALSWIEGFVQIGYYAVADGVLALLVAAAVHRSIDAPAAFGWTVTDAAVRLVFGTVMIVVPFIGLFPLTRILFFAVLTKVALVLGLIGIAYVAWMFWRRKGTEPLLPQRLVLLSSTCTILFAIALGASTELGTHSKEVTGGYALLFGMLLAFVALQTRPLQHQRSSRSRRDFSGPQ